jgi:[acyl-carrier-protein] S-malonyltransferase
MDVNHIASLGIVFPGQGSQSVGMLSKLADEFPDIVTGTFAEASRALGYDLWELVRQGPGEALNATERTQPAMLATGVAVWRVWCDKNGPRPAYLAGHSLGEYTALVAAGVIEFGTAIKLVAERGRCMQQAVPEGHGAMAAIMGLDDETLRTVCALSGNDEVVSCANYNAPGQTVIAGHRAAVERAIAAAGRAGAKRAILLPVSVPSHCILMKPAADTFAATLAQCEFVLPSIPVLHNVDVASHPDVAAIKDALVRQLYSPVRWVDLTRKLLGEGIHTIVECGPGKVLAGLCKRVDKSLNCLPVFDGETLRTAMTEIDK